MPELPEVETIRRSLLPLISGKRIAAFYSFTPEVFSNFSTRAGLEGAVVQGLSRHGKYLLAELGDSVLMIHLRMTGKLLYEDQLPGLDGISERLRTSRANEPSGMALPCLRAEDLPPHTRALIVFTDGSALRFQDIRRFGRLKLLPADDFSADRGLSGLGKDALSPDWTAEDLIREAKHHAKAPIKGVLLMQDAVAGIGNIYADESLFRAGIRPDRPAGRISAARLTRLHEVVQAVLERAVGLGGTSFRDYVNGLGGKGHFQLELAVYQKENQACPVCGQPIRKIETAGRGTRFCPHCQH